MEFLLHYAWKHRLYRISDLQLEEGNHFEIIDPGIHNTNAGPDFFNAKIKIDDHVWAGNIEIHCASSDWYTHRHHEDKAYNSVILHVVERINETEIRTESGQIIPQWQMTLPEHLKESYQQLIDNTPDLLCARIITELPEIYLMDWKETLLYERLERKSESVIQLLATYQNDWNEAFYITLARNFGFSINNDAFERLAKLLPLKTILKHGDSILQTEALFLGVAGFLSDDESCEDEYFCQLQKEYRFLRQKYDLRELDAHLFKSLRIRPSFFPVIKLVQLASIVRSIHGLFSALIEKPDIQTLIYSLNTDIHPYWLTHYQFGKESASRPKQLGRSSRDLLLINTIIPVLFSYGKQRSSEEHVHRAVQLLEQLPMEKNYIITQFARAGIRIENAGDSQAIIQLKKEYCEKKKCIYCRIGHKLLSKNTNSE